mgnify:CR=1 FL=1
MSEVGAQISTQIQHILSMFLVSGKEIDTSKIALILLPLCLPLLFPKLLYLLRYLWHKLRSKKDEYTLTIYEHENPVLTSSRNSITSRENGSNIAPPPCNLFGAVSKHLSICFPEKAEKNRYLDISTSSYLLGKKKFPPRFAFFPNIFHEIFFQGEVIQIMKTNEDISSGIVKDKAPPRIHSYVIKSQKKETLDAFIKEISKKYRNYLYPKNKAIWKEVSTAMVMGQDSYSQASKKIRVNKTFANLFWPSSSLLKLRTVLDYFLVSKDKYQNAGIPYKLGFLFHGLPGTGKTAAIYALANELKRIVYSLNRDCFTGEKTLASAVRNIAKNSIVVIEDIDTVFPEDIKGLCAKLLRKRLEKEGKKDRKEKEEETDEEAEEGKRKEGETEKDEGKQAREKKEKKLDEVSRKKKAFKSLLQILDGYNHLYGCIIIMTTNCVASLDSALIRPGRIDHQFEFTFADSEQIQTICSKLGEITISKKEAKAIEKQNWTTGELINTIVFPNQGKRETILQLALPNKS